MTPSAAEVFDVQAARAWFPAFDSATNAGWAFLENAGGAFVPRPVIERMTRFLTDAKVQPGAPFAASALATEMITEGTRAAALLLNVPPERVVLGADTTTNLYVLANALADLLDPGDEIIVTNLDHESNITPWRRLTRTGATVREWRLDPRTGALDLAELAALLTENTRLVCCPHAANTTGAELDAAAVVRMAHSAGAIAVVDGVSFAPHACVDLAALNADAYVFSAYKVFGPHLGVMALRPELLGRLTNQNHMHLNDTGALTLNPGGPPHELAAALAGVTDYFAALVGVETLDRPTLEALFSGFQAHQRTLCVRLLDGLAAVPGYRVLGPADPNQPRAPTVAFVHERLPSAAVAEALGQHRIAVRHGHFYAWRAIEALGLVPEDGIVRASLVHYNTAEDIDRLLAHLPRG